jgi:hypothetical protein
LTSVGLTGVLAAPLISCLAGIYFTSVDLSSFFFEIAGDFITLPLLTAEDFLDEGFFKDDLDLAEAFTIVIVTLIFFSLSTFRLFLTLI